MQGGYFVFYGQPSAVAPQLHLCSPVCQPLSSVFLVQLCVPCFESFVFHLTAQYVSAIGAFHLLVGHE